MYSSLSVCCPAGAASCAPRATVAEALAAAIPGSAERTPNGAAPPAPAVSTAPEAATPGAAVPQAGAARPRRWRVAGVVAVGLFAVMLIGLLAAVELRLTTTTAELGTVQRSIGDASGPGGPQAGSILAQLDQLGRLRGEISAMTGQVGQVATDLHGLSAGGTALAALPGISAELALLGRQVTVLGGQLSGVSAAVAPLGSLDSALVALQAKVAALERALSPATPAG